MIFVVLGFACFLIGFVGFAALIVGARADDQAARRPISDSEAQP